MVETRPTNRSLDDRLRTGSGLDYPLPHGTPGTAVKVGGYRPRIPTMAQLAKLLVNGILVLPRNYRRGMFLDILV